MNTDAAPGPSPHAPEFYEASELPTLVVSATDFPLADMASLFDSTFAALMPELDERGIAPAGVPFSLHHRMPTTTSDLEVGVPVPVALSAPIQRGEVVLTPSAQPAGSAARATYVGPYEGLGAAWETFMTAIAESGHTPRFPFWEVYVTAPSPDVDPSMMRTDLHTLVVRA